MSLAVMHSLVMVAGRSVLSLLAPPCCSDTTSRSAFLAACVYVCATRYAPGETLRRPVTPRRLCRKQRAGTTAGRRGACCSTCESFACLHPRPMSPLAQHCRARNLHAKKPRAGLKRKQNTHSCVDCRATAVGSGGDRLCNVTVCTTSLRSCLAATYRYPRLADS